jgi:hypothetical protein
MATERRVQKKVKLTGTMHKKNHQSTLSNLAIIAC